jgi:membrane associated rhomboid family serine protease
MAYNTRYYARGYLSGSRLPPGIKALLIANTAIFLLEWLADRAAPSARLSETLEYYFGLTPAAVVGSLRVWQLVTYMFLHAGIWHILWNMLALWMFGVELEGAWGTEKFLRFYFLCGVGAGVCVVLMNYLPFGNPGVLTIGASGAIYGVLAASAALWPDRIILAFFFFPMKMKYFVMIIGAITFLNTWNPSSGVSDIAHLSGLLFGYLYVKSPRWSTSGGSGFHPLAGLQSGYLTWKRNRARRKFQVYLSKQARDRDRW